VKTFDEHKPQPENILECRKVYKSFGGTAALTGVEMSVRRGKVHALVGENGAGKSTLMNIVGGLLQKDSGSIWFEGEPYRASNPVEAIHAGISMIHQELNPEPYLSIAENIFLNREDTYGRSPFLNKKATNERARAVLESFGLDMSPKVHMEQLTLAQMQMIEIIKAVSTNARLVIMDEPTSSLDSEETARLFSTIQNLKESGVTIIYISHRMDEIFSICDSYSVFRDGNSVGSGRISDVSRDDLISMMVGFRVESIFPKTDCKIGDVVFRAENLSGRGFSDISFDVRAGEIVGIAGLVGSGRSETMRAIFGLDPLESGRMYMDGREIRNKTVRDAMKFGIAMINEDRKAYGLCLFRSIKENISLASLEGKHRRPWISLKRERVECSEIAKKLNVKMANLDTEAFALSGGNQQKIVVAKWLMETPRLLILDEPTRGVDVGAKAEIHGLMSEFAADGMAIIMVSSELPEVMGMSDRVLVYHEGRIQGVVPREKILSEEETQETILAREFGKEKGE